MIALMTCPNQNYNRKKWSCVFQLKPSSILISAPNMALTLYPTSDLISSLTPTPTALTYNPSNGFDALTHEHTAMALLISSAMAPIIALIYSRTLVTSIVPSNPLCIIYVYVFAQTIATSSAPHSAMATIITLKITRIPVKICKSFHKLLSNNRNYKKQMFLLNDKSFASLFGCEDIVNRTTHINVHVYTIGNIPSNNTPNTSITKVAYTSTQISK